MANPLVPRGTASIIPLAQEVQQVRDEPPLWDYEFAYVEIGDSYARRRWEHTWEKFCREKKTDIFVGIIAALLGAAVSAVTLVSVFWSFFAGLGGLVVGLGLVLLAFWLFAPREMDADIRGDLQAAKDQFLEEQRKLHRVALIAVQDHVRYVNSLRATFKGKIRQVFLDDFAMEVTDLDSQFITIQLDLWNVRDNAAIVQEFLIRTYSDVGILDGTQVSIDWFTYTEKEIGNLLDPHPVFLQACEMPKSPVPGGYVSGSRQDDKWLRFRVDGIDWMHREQFKSSFSAMELRIIDGDDELHVIPWSGSPSQHGTIDCTFGPTGITDELAHAILAETHDSLSRQLQKCREGIVPDDRLTKLYLDNAADTLKKWKGIGYETEFNRCPDRALEEMSSWSPACKKAGMVLYPRIEKLAEYIREIRAKH